MNQSTDRYTESLTRNEDSSRPLDRAEKMFIREFSVRYVSRQGMLLLQQRMRDLDDRLVWVDVPIVQERQL
jgi:hypothetical protein